MSSDVRDLRRSRRSLVARLDFVKETHVFSRTPHPTSEPHRDGNPIDPRHRLSIDLDLDDTPKLTPSHESVRLFP